MKDFLHSIRFKILIGIIAFILGIMLYGGIIGGTGSFVSSAIGIIVSPFQKASSSISENVGSFFDKIANADDYYDENKRLHEQLDEMYKNIIDYDKVKSENEQLREMLGLKQKFSEYEFSSPCRVIGWVQNDIYMSFFIDKGSKDDIKLHDPVMTSSGIVGIVDSVEYTYARVTTVLSPKYPIGVYCSRTKDQGVIEGNVEAAKKGMLYLKHVNIDSDIKKGDILVTSGYSGLVPKDTIIGVVDSVEIAQNGLSQNALVKPIVDIDSLTDVFVITDFDGQGEGYDE